MSLTGRLIFCIVCLHAVTGAATADPWPAWRGPTGQGHSQEKDLPLRWSAKENIRWKASLDQAGNSTPVIWGERVFLTQGNPGGSIRSLICLSSKNGKEVWSKNIPFALKEKNWNETWYGNASPVTDGERVVVSFGSAGLFCYGVDGTELWKRNDLGHWEHPFGNSSSPIIWNDLVILWCGPQEKPIPGTDSGKANSLMAFDKKTGKTVWEHQESVGSWCTPLVTKVEGRDQLLLGLSRDVKNLPIEKSGYLKGIDPATGKELWKCQGLNSNVYTSPLVGKGIAVAMSGYSGSALAVKLGGQGDITSSRLWLHPKNPQRVGSGVIVGDHVYMVDETGPPRCFDLVTGEDQWRTERPTKAVTWGSMTHADGRLYLLMRDGETLVMAAKPKFELLARNKLGEETNSSIAIADGAIYIRTFKHLWCIAEPNKTSP